MSTPQEAQPSKAANGAFTPSLYSRSLSGFRSWLSQRAFSLAPPEAKSEAPAALRDAALQFSSRVWDIAEAQAHERLAAERASVNERVNEANGKVAAAVLARGRAENHASQLEKKFSVAERTRQDLAKDLAAAETRAKSQRAESDASQKKQQAENEMLFKDRADLERRLEEAESREAQLQKEIASLRSEIEVLEAEAEKHEETQQRHLEKAKQHYASLESRLASLLEEHKSARQGLEKGGRGR
jgi:chromosome segregation ATPase